jgi:hypothetical protein
MKDLPESPVEKVFGQDKTLAFVLDTSTSSVWRLVKKGIIPPPVKVNGLSRFDIKKSVAAFRAAGEADQGLKTSDQSSFHKGGGS